MQTTNNLGLKKPSENDFINVEDLNYNADILDSKVKEALDKTVEVINELDSSETNKALSAAQGKELKRLIDEVPQVEVVNNLSTQNGQKALSAAQGVVIAEQLKKSGLKIANATYHNNTIAIEDFTPQEDVLFLLNLSSVHRDSMQIDRNTKVAFGSRLLKITKFNDIEFLEATEIKQRQFICVKKVDAVWMEVYSAELDNKIFELQQRVSECFQSARDGKVKLADAITSKGQVVDNEASFQEMADSIREIQVGKYDVGDILAGKNFVYFGEYTTYSSPNTYSISPYNYLCTTMSNKDIYIVFKKQLNSGGIQLALKRVEINYANGEIKNTSDLYNPRGLYDCYIDLNKKNNHNYFDLNDIVLSDKEIFISVKVGIGVLLLVFDFETGKKGELTKKAEFLFKSTSNINTIEFFLEKKAWVFTKQNSISVCKYSSESNSIIEESYQINISQNEKVFFATPNGFYKNAVEKKGGDGERDFNSYHKNTITFFDFSDVGNPVKSTVINAQYLRVGYPTSYYQGNVNIPFRKFYFESSTKTSHYDYFREFYQLDYLTHEFVKIGYSSYGDSDRIGFVNNCRFAPVMKSYGGIYEPHIYLPNIMKCESLKDWFRKLGGININEYAKYFIDSDSLFVVVQENQGTSKGFFIKGYTESVKILS